MDLHQTINRIKNTANLLVTKIKMIWLRIKYSKRNCFYIPIVNKYLRKIYNYFQNVTYFIP